MRVTVGKKENSGYKVIRYKKQKSAVRQAIASVRKEGTAGVIVMNLKVRKRRREEKEAVYIVIPRTLSDSDTVVHSITIAISSIQPQQQCEAVNKTRDNANHQ